jgi:hypothetical protein
VTEISSSFSTLAQAEDELSDAYRWIRQSLFLALIRRHISPFSLCIPCLLKGMAMKICQANRSVGESVPRAVSTTFDKTGKIISDHAVMDELLMREPLRGVVLDTGAARDVIRGR